MFRWIGKKIEDLTTIFQGDVITNNRVVLNNIVKYDSDDGRYLVINEGTVSYRDGTDLKTDGGLITAVTITTDSGSGTKASDTTGSADFSLLGNSGVGITNSGATITAVSVPGEINHDLLLNFVANEHIDWSSEVESVIHATNYTDTQYSSASASSEGIVELATTAETTTGTDTTRAVTPDGLKDGYQGSTNVTTLGTITTGVFRGTAISATYLDGQSGTNTGDETLASINALDITEVGTIDSGVWNGTAIASQYTKHLMHYQFIGYTVGDGTNYEMPQALTDGQAPFEHADSSSSDGLTIPAASGTNQSEMIRMGGWLMVNTVTLKKWSGIATNTNNKELTIGLFKWTPADNSAGDITPVLLEEVTIDGKGNDKTRTFTTTSFEATVSAGDIIFSQLKTESSGNVGYFNSTLEAEF
tara:strand:+ start:1281 stop:2531 length:1251 start_codon:yes stop_codon:yes gene_type:complete